MEKIELRLLFDCERNEKILQYRYIDETGVDSWANVPVVYSLLDATTTVRNQKKIDKQI